VLYTRLVESWSLGIQHSSTIAALNAELSSAQARVQRVVDENDGLASELNVAREELNVVRDELANARAREQQLAGENAELVVRREDAEARYGTLTVDHAALVNQLNDALETEKQKEEELTVLRSSLTALRNSNAWLVSRVDGQILEIKGLQRRNDALVVDISVLRTAAPPRRARHDVLRDVLSRGDVFPCLRDVFKFADVLRDVFSHGDAFECLRDVFRFAEWGENGSVICPITSEPIGQFLVLECRHVFESGKLHEWWRTKDLRHSCPLCRAATSVLFDSANVGL
jgi:predicted  nucleic acid-binding Zn-ribbon protein